MKGIGTNMRILKMKYKGVKCKNNWEWIWIKRNIKFTKKNDWLYKNEN